MSIDDLVARLALSPHPEGGWYRETWRSAASVVATDGRQRQAGTHIHFMLAAGQVSRWHRVQSDELWLHRDGGPLELWIAEPDGGGALRHLLAGPTDQVVVPPGYWQAARPVGDWALVSCIVTPGFDFADFALLTDDDAAASALAAGVGHRDFHPSS